MMRLKYQTNIMVNKWFFVLLVDFCCSILLVPLTALDAVAAQPDTEINKNTPINKIITPLVNHVSVAPALFDCKVFEALLKEQFKVVKQNSSFPFPTLALRDSNIGELDPIDGKYEVLTVQQFDDKGFFRHQKILLVSVSSIFLEARIKVSNRSSGLFALEDKKLTYLNGKDSVANVSKILRRENRPLSEADALMLANLFAKTILRQDNDRVEVMLSPDDILRLDKPNAEKINEIIKKKKLGRLYSTTVDKAELEKCKAQFIEPQMSDLTKEGWQCRFIGLRGFMHTIQVPFALIEYKILISPDFDINVSKDVLSAKIII